MREIPFLNLEKVNAEIIGEIRGAIDRVLNSGWYIMGNELKNFEQDMKTDLVGNKEGYIVGCNSGTDAIILSLLAAGVRSGDEVITVSHTAIPTIAAIVAIGASPTFVDVNEKTWVMDIDQVNSKLSKRTKAIIAVHLYGNMVDVFKLKEVLANNCRDDIAIIEDVAQAQGAFLSGNQAGTIGDFGAFSFYPSKNIGALGDGGAVFCTNEDNFNLLTMYRNYGQKDRYNALISNGLNSRLDEVQASILSIKLKYLHCWNKRKANIMEFYQAQLSMGKFQFQEVTANCKPAWHLCVLAYPNETRRNKAIQVLNENKIQSLIHYPIPTHMQRAFSCYCNNNDNLKVTEQLAKRIISIPFNTSLEEHEQKRIVKVLKELS